MVSQAIPVCQLLSGFPIECGIFRHSNELGASFRHEEYGSCTDGTNSNFRVGRKLCKAFSEEADAFVESDAVLQKSRLISRLTAAIDEE